MYIETCNAGGVRAGGRVGTTSVLSDGSGAENAFVGGASPACVQNTYEAGHAVVGARVWVNHRARYRLSVPVSNMFGIAQI